MTTFPLEYIHTKSMHILIMNNYLHILSEPSDLITGTSSPRSWSLNGDLLKRALVLTLKTLGCSCPTHYIMYFLQQKRFPGALVLKISYLWGLCLLILYN